MFITFNPSLGDTIHVTRPALFPKSQPTSLLFSAHLTALEYHDLIRDGARVQLWSDLPCDNGSGWGELEFTESLNNSAKPFTNHYTVSLDSSPQNHDSEGKTLRLLVSIPSTTSGTCCFSFTYRVTYPSGRTTWLGAFGQNGSLVVIEPEDILLPGLTLREGWLEDNMREARKFEIAEGPHSVELANIDHPSEFRIWALGSDRLLPHPSNASVLFLVPKGQKDSIVLNLTYVMSASPNSTITISPEGRVTASGPGIILLQTNNIASGVGPFIQQIISRCKLDQWKSLSSNPKGNTIALSSPSSHYPREVAIIPLWSCQGIQLPLIFTNPFAGKGKSEAMALAVFSSSKSPIYVFDNETNNELCLEMGPFSASTKFRFSICPVYKLWQPPAKTSRNWAVAILTPHNRVPTPLISDHSGALPTPPPSPYLPPISSLSHSTSPSAVSSIIEYMAATHEASASEEESPSTSFQISPELVPSAATEPPPSKSLVSLFASIFASFKPLFRFFFKIFLCPIRPLGFGHSQRKTRVESEDARLGDPVDSADSPEEISVPNKDESLSQNLSGHTGTDGLTIPLEHEGLRLISSDSTAAVTQPKYLSGALPIMGTSEDVFRAELKYDETQEEDSTTATVEIVFMPLPCRSSGNRDVDAVSATNEELERAVCFLDGSLQQSSLREVDIFFHDASAGSGEATRKSSCYLLRYQFDTMSLKNGKTISILPPVVSGA